VVFQLTLLRFPFPGFPGIPAMVTQNRAFHDQAVALGGKRYLIGAIPDTTAQDWRRHYGPLWPVFQAAKALFDPDSVLTPGQPIF
jgi:FAD/FMN-containing dehydrogenase